MATVKYNGEYPEGADSIVQHGVTFERGKTANVSDEDVVAKLATNRFFEVSGESDKAQVATGKDEAERAEAESLRAYLDDKNVPYRANASLDNLRSARKDYDAAVLKAQDA